MNGYNLIAPYYQFFVKLVFGNLLFKAQTHFLTKDVNPAHILIVGGGSGQLLTFCLIRYPSAQITYVESSKKMIELSKRKTSELDKIRVNFQCQSILDWNDEVEYEIVLLPFVLDLFSNKDCHKLLIKLKAKIRSESRIIVADFFNSNSIFQKALIMFMYVLFRSICASDRTTLPNYQLLFKKSNLIIEKEKKHGKAGYKDLVVSYQLAPCKTM